MFCFAQIIIYNIQSSAQIILQKMGSSEGLRGTLMAYRNLVKAVKKHIGKEVHFTDFIKQEFRNTKDPSFIQQRIKLAQNYTYLLNTVHHHKDLLFSYNIAVDRSDEMTRVLGKSAASVGLRLPEVYQP